jgi:hypothetical protein
MAAFAIMTSVLAFYYRLARDASMLWFSYVLHATMAFSVIRSLIFLLVQIFLCR